MTLAQSSFRQRRGLPIGISAEVAEREITEAFMGVNGRLGQPITNCRCSALGGEFRCPEHGRRCANCDSLSALGISELCHQSKSGVRTYYCDHHCLEQRHAKVKLDPPPEFFAINKSARPLNFPITVTVPRETPDPYLSHRLKEEAIGQETLRVLTDTLPTNEVARARNIAALKLELAKPFERRFPHEGRSDRVYLENRK